MKIKKILLTAIFVVALILLFNITSYAGSQEWNSLNYDVQLQDNGDMKVIETWDIKVSNTNTLFKTFDLNNSKYSGITDVKVYDATNNMALTQIDKQMYHVTKNCYYGLKINLYQFEIAWGVGADTSTIKRTYKIEYTIKSAVTNYSDCSELYWMFLNKSNAIPAKVITGTIKLPSEVSDINNLKVWAHGPLNGKIERKSNDTVYFQVKNFSKETMLEVRVVSIENIFTNNNKTKNQKVLDEIIEEETENAEIANSKRWLYRIPLAIYVIIVIINGFSIFQTIKNIPEDIKEVIDKEQECNIEYFRDIPREDATPAEAAYIKDFEGNISYADNTTVFSATIMDLCLKGYVEFEKTNNDTIIILKKEEDIEKLKSDEKRIYHLLKNAAKKENILSMTELKRFARKDYTYVTASINGLDKFSMEAHKKLGNIDDNEIKIYKELKGKKFGSRLGIVISVAFYIFIIMAKMNFSCGILTLLILPLPLLIESIIKLKIYGKTAKQYNGLTEKGKQEKDQWIGLYNYLNDYSLLSEKDITDLVLWEKYLIFSTAFGISETVVKRFKEVVDAANIAQNFDITDTRYLLINQMMINNVIDTNVFTSISREMNSVYSVANTAAVAASSANSSGIGSGGGFSGGGGGRRWRRWRRPVAEEDKITADIP